MIVYEQELKDGLEDIEKNNSIAYISNPINIIVPHVDIEKLITYASHIGASLESKDLHQVDSILASVGWNSNDDVFDKHETFAARNTPVNKPFNFMHNEHDIIGHMTASILLDEHHNIITESDISKVPDKFDIAVSSVLYKIWQDENLQSRMNKIIAEIAEKKWFVSMECIFNDFDYAVISPEGKHQTIARTSKTSFLTKHLRVYGGTGIYNGYKLGRKLKSFIFAGKGLVDNPANKRSIIFTPEDVKQFKSQANIILPQKEEEMEEVLKKLEEARASDTKVLEAVTFVSETLKKAGDAQVAYESSVAKLKETHASELAERDEVIKSKDKTIAELQGKVEEITTAKVALESKKVVAERLAKAATAGISAEEAKVLVEKWATVTDAQFEDVVKLAVANVKVPEKGTASADLDSAELETDDKPSTNPPSQDDTHQKAVAWFSDILGVKNSK